MFLNKKCLKRHFSFLIVLLAGDQLKAEAFVGKKWQGNILPIKFFIFYSTHFLRDRLDRRIQCPFISSKKGTKIIKLPGPRPR